MKKILLPVLVLLTLLISACAPATPVPTAAPTQAAIANPASVFCTEHGGKLAIVTASDGSQTGNCTLTDGKQCDEWAFYRGECGVANAALAAPQATQPVPSRSAEQASRLSVQKLADGLKIDAASIQVTSTETVTWPDACLGLAGADEMCAQVETPGFRVVLSADGKSYTLHTDASGENVRQEPVK